MTNRQKYSDVFVHRTEQGQGDQEDQGLKQNRTFGEQCYSALVSGVSGSVMFFHGTGLGSLGDSIRIKSKIHTCMRHILSSSERLFLAQCTVCSLFRFFLFLSMHATAGVDNVVHD